VSAREWLADRLTGLALVLKPAAPPLYGVRLVPDWEFDPVDELGPEGAIVRDKIHNGELGAYGIILIRECPECGTWDEGEDPDGSAWGVLLDPGKLPAWSDSPDHVGEHIDMSPVGLAWHRMPRDFREAAAKVMGDRCER
jgi:hypothetical protein